MPPDALGAVSRGSTRACTQLTNATPGSAVAGFVEVPALHTTAPVLQGDGPGQLQLAVGHPPGASWPGGSGVAVLVSPGASWFSGLGTVRRGDQVIFVGPCGRFTYSVLSSATKAASPQTWAQTAAAHRGRKGGQLLRLVTTEPLNALWQAPRSFVVTAALTKVAKAPWHPPGSVTPPLGPKLELARPISPSALPQPGLLTLSGNPDPAWAQTAAPLAVGERMVGLYGAAVLAAGEGWGRWRAALSPRPAVVATTDAMGLKGASGTYGSRTNVGLVMAGSTVVAGRAQAIVHFSGGKAVGLWKVTVQARVRGGFLVVDGFSMVPIGQTSPRHAKVGAGVATAMARVPTGGLGRLLAPGPAQATIPFTFSSTPTTTPTSQPPHRSKPAPPSGPRAVGSAAATAPRPTAGSGQRRSGRHSEGG